MLQLQSAFGIVALLALAWAFGENRRAVSLRQTAIGLAVTVATAVVLIKFPGVAHVFGAINDAVGAIASSSRAGTSFVFGYLGGGALPFDLKSPGADFILAFQALPIVLVMSVLTFVAFVRLVGYDRLGWGPKVALAGAAALCLAAWLRPGDRFA